MKQIIKKTAAFLLSLSLIFSVFVFNFSALTPEKLVINECDSLEGWVGSNLQPTTDQAQACNSAAAISRNSNYGVFIGGYEPAEPIDISDYTYIEWDMMFMLSGDTTGAMWEQILAAYSSTGTNNTLFLRLSSNENKSERAIWRSSALEVTQPYANKNWFHFKAAIDNPNDAGTFDPTKMTEFYFTTCDSGETYFDKSIGSGVIRIDNIYATGLKEQPVVPGDANGDGVTDLLDLIRIKKYLAGTVSEISAGADMNSNGIVNNFDMVCLRKLLLGVDYTSDVEPVETVTITDCETEDGWTQESNNTGLELQPGRGVGGTGAIYAYGGYGALRKITYTLGTPIDLSGTATLEWDQYTVVQGGENLGTEQFETVYKAYKDYAAVAVSDGDTEAAFSVSKWQVGEPGEGNYRHIAVSLADSGLNLANIESITFYTLPQNVGQLDTSVPTAVFRFDNIIATANAVTPNWSGVGDNSGTAFMPAMFSNNMMFQQNKDMNLWGITNEPNESVTAQLYKGTQLVETKTATSDADGNWSLAFEPRSGSYDTYEIKVTSDDQTKDIRNILIGELWIASGQSNMEYFLGNTATDRSTIPLDKYIRVFKEPSVPTPDGANGILSSVPVYDIVPDTNNINTIGLAVWTDASVEMNVRYVSAVAYYAAVEMRAELDVPVGFINTAKGASVIEAWLSRESIDNNPVIKDKLTDLRLYKTENALNASKNWQFMTTLYNTKLAPLAGLNENNEKRSEHAGFNIAGVLWYQGESNIKYAESDGSNPYYTAALNQLINDWSEIFGFENGDMPFVVADIAGYDYSNVMAVNNTYDYVIAMLSESISDACAEHTNAIHVPIYDLPLTYKDPPALNYDPIHPSDKKPVGQRFAQAMLAEFYGIGTYNAPVLTDVTVSNGKLILTFDNVGTGLKSKDGNMLRGFTICGADRVFVNADAIIINANQVEVSSPYVKNPVAATYAFASYTQNANLAGGDGTPAFSFRSDKVNSTYLGIDDWLSADIEKVWVVNAGAATGGFENTWTADAGVSLTFDTDVKASGISSIKVTTNSMGKGFAPDLTLDSVRNHLSDYKYISVKVKNDGNAQNELSLIFGGAGYAKTVDGELSAVLDAGSGFTTYIFDISTLYRAGGSVLSNADNYFSLGMEFVLANAGTIHIDEIRLATEI